MNDYQITTERVDDVPLLLAQMERMGIAAAIDTHFHRHGNRQGLSYGWLAVVWLTHILSQADHRMNRVRDWVMTLVTTLTACLPVAWRPLDFTDDRLADLTRAFSDDQTWAACEANLTHATIRAYDLETLRARLDTTTSASYCDITPDGLFQFGHSKDHRPDLAQIKVMLASLDPLGMPLALTVVPGDVADDGLYWPIIQQVQTSLQRTGVLFIGDSKLPALATRAAIQQAQQYYLAPLSQVQMPAALLHAWIDQVLATPLELEPIWRTDADGRTTLIALGCGRQVRHTAAHAAHVVTWDEQQWLIQSQASKVAHTRALHERLARAEAALATLVSVGSGRRRCPQTPEAITAAADAILRRERVQGLLDVTITSQAHTQTKRAWRGRPAHDVTTVTITLTVTRNATAVTQAEAYLGWRVYVTNQAPSHLRMAAALLAYRDEYLIERSFSRLKGQPLSLRPWFVSRADHAKGLIRLLSLGLRVLALVEHTIRTQLQETDEPLVGLAAGQPNRATPRPTTEAVLRAFRHLTVTIIHVQGQVVHHLTPLSTLQQRLLALMRLDSSCYTRLTTHSSVLPGK
jgi:transposase